VNVPEYRLDVREQGRSALQMRVIVGDKAHPTPLFHADMETVVFSPYWHIPDSIALGETAPAVRRDAEYLKRNNIEVLRVSGSKSEVIDPDDVDWDDPGAVKQVRLRQRPGAANALGHVKFLFPNRHAVYLHDTPADDLFSRENRALSHGCVRLDQPADLARYVLRNRPEWDEQAIKEAMRSGTQQEVTLDQPLPVFLVYFTAVLGPDGELVLLDDVYGHDGRHAAHLRQPKEIF
jgi:murein L,D-transpeptidase YcbB/YkuD